MTLERWHEILCAHDWHWRHADDARVYAAGRSAHITLENVAMAMGGEYLEAFRRMGRPQEESDAE